MAVIRLMNQANIPSAQFDILSKAVQHYVPLVVAAWKLNACTVEANGSINAGDWVVYITEANRKNNAAGYHTEVNGVPVAYCSPKASYRTFGAFSKAFYVLKKLIHPDMYAPGLVTTI